MGLFGIRMLLGILIHLALVVLKQDISTIIHFVKKNLVKLAYFWHNFI